MIKINEMYPAIQGEGVMAGKPMFIIRFQGCGVGCSFCDSKAAQRLPENYPSKLCLTNELANKNKDYFVPMSIKEIIAQVVNQWPLEWIIITGGEPCMQQDDNQLPELVVGLNAMGFKVALETSGCYPIKNATDYAWITVSPKLYGEVKFRKASLLKASEIKFPVMNLTDIGTMKEMIGNGVFGDDKRKPIVSIHPVMDKQSIPSKLAKAFLPEWKYDNMLIELCEAACFEKNWRLSIQTHKLIGLK